MKSKIVFGVYPPVVPYEVIKYLESFKIRVWPIKVDFVDNSGRNCTIEVNNKQFKWACGLIEGYSNAVVLLEPTNIKPIKPKSRWNNDRASVTNFTSFVVRVLSEMFSDIKPQLPKVKKK